MPPPLRRLIRRMSAAALHFRSQKLGAPLQGVESELLEQPVLRKDVGLYVCVEKTREEIRMLSGLLPICAWCKQVRDDEGYWGEIETFVSARSDAQFTHSICPSCMEGVDARVEEAEREEEEPPPEGGSTE